MRTLQYLLCVSLLLVLASCDDGDSGNATDFGEFTMETPVTWQVEKQQGYDSKVWQVTAPDGGIISFDLGGYSDNLNVDSQNHEIFFSTIDNKNAKIVKPKVVGTGTTGVYFENIGGQNKFQMSGTNLSAHTQAQLLKAIPTLRFK